MAKPTAPQCHAMTTYYINAFRERYKRDPNVNRNTARWNWEGILTDMPPSKAKELVDFYFSTTSQKQHALDWFFYNYDKLRDTMSDQEVDRERRRKMRAESEARAAEWRARGNTGIASN